MTIDLSTQLQFQTTDNNSSITINNNTFNQHFSSPILPFHVPVFVPGTRRAEEKGWLPEVFASEQEKGRGPEILAGEEKKGRGPGAGDPHWRGGIFKK